MIALMPRQLRNSSATPLTSGNNTIVDGPAVTESSSVGTLQERSDPAGSFAPTRAEAAPAPAPAPR